MKFTKKYPYNLIEEAYIKNLELMSSSEKEKYSKVLFNDDYSEGISERLIETIGKMKPAYQEVIYAYFHEGKTYRQIASDRSVSANRIGQMLHNVYRDLRKPFNVDYILLNDINDEPSGLLMLSNRTSNCIKRSGIKDTNTLVKMVINRPVFIAKIRNMGDKSLKELEDALKENKLIPEDFHVKSYDEFTLEEIERENKMRNMEDRIVRSLK